MIFWSMTNFQSVLSATSSMVKATSVYATSQTGYVTKEHVLHLTTTDHVFEIFAERFQSRTWDF